VKGTACGGAARAEKTLPAGARDKSTVRRKDKAELLSGYEPEVALDDNARRLGRSVCLRCCRCWRSERNKFTGRRADRNNPEAAGGPPPLSCFAAFCRATGDPSVRLGGLPFPRYRRTSDTDRSLPKSREDGDPSDRRAGDPVGGPARTPLGDLSCRPWKKPASRPSVYGRRHLRGRTLASTRTAPPPLK